MPSLDSSKEVNSFNQRSSSLIVRITRSVSALPLGLEDLLDSHERRIPHEGDGGRLGAVVAYKLKALVSGSPRKFFA